MANRKVHNSGWIWDDHPDWQRVSTWPEHQQQNRMGIRPEEQYDSSGDYYRPLKQRRWMQDKLHALQTEEGFQDASRLRNFDLGTQYWKPGTVGRGLVDSYGNVHTWPEDHGSHDEYMQLRGIQNAPYLFGINPEGNVSTFIGNHEPFGDVLRHHGLTPPQPEPALDDWSF